MDFGKGNGSGLEKVVEGDHLLLCWVFAQGLEAGCNIAGLGDQCCQNLLLDGDEKVDVTVVAARLNVLEE